MEHQNINHALIDQSPFLNLGWNDLKEILGIKGSHFEMRVSPILLEELREGLVTEKIHANRVIDVIRSLENGDIGGLTGPAERFTGKVLTGFWKKHFFQAGYLVKNIQSHFKVDNPRSEKLLQKVSELRKKFRKDSEFFAMLSHELTFGAYEEKAKKKQLTGEWIIFKKIDDQNYYLTIAFHDELDEVIRERAISALDKLGFKEN